MLEALEIIEIPPEPPEQAGRSLYERLEISGMRNQLLRRAIDLKKNIAGTVRFLDVLREMSAVVSESKMFLLNESVELNTKTMCSLQDSGERAAGLLQKLLMLTAASFAWGFLDRFTGQWTVTSGWASGLYESIQSTALLWFLVSIIFWLGFWQAFKNSVSGDHYKKQGVTTVRLRFDRKVFVQRLKDYLNNKVHSYEEYHFGDIMDLIKITFVDPNKADWGGFSPTVTFEYDERNEFLLTVSISYNHRMAKKALIMSGEDLREKITGELTYANVWDTQSEDKSHEDLAADKRAAIQKLLDAEEEEEEMGAAAAASIENAKTK